MNGHAGQSISVFGKVFNGTAIGNLHAAAAPNQMESGKKQTR
jgi:hypothetical protein